MSRNLENPLLDEWVKAMAPYYEHQASRYGIVGDLLWRPPPAKEFELVKAELSVPLEELAKEAESRPREYTPPTKAEMDLVISPFRARQELVIAYSWAVPTEEAIEAIAAHSPAGVVEIGAGGGYWAKLMRDYGIDVVAYDRTPYMGYRAWTKEEVRVKWSTVRRGGPKMASKHPERSLFLCWPPYDTSMAYDALCAYSGKTVLYVGEGGGGCTGDDAFHDELERNWREVQYVHLPQWSGLHDDLYIYKRKRRRKR